MNKDLDKALKAKFLCQTKFTQDIENLVKDNDDLNYIDAIVHYCEQNKIERIHDFFLNYSSRNFSI